VKPGTELTAAERALVGALEQHVCFLDLRGGEACDPAGADAARDEQWNEKCR
jgi:hypothetical protein